ncbi:uncharacterized protein SAPINGB_P000992 [Magnusiomyces paraingens]|uniref:Uncharacterized protein n=1 Tax=Magnusiomyces paraingens TaxID=2606893 RepID=A0A5E8B413_9ASCO|nr:uncharacterized protein SAPINGB_P000992 [Saprochaete ingens]VVT45991.1 unnamed protein product [Saprochaete ingens]
MKPSRISLSMSAIGPRSFGLARAPALISPSSLLLRSLAIPRKTPQLQLPQSFSTSSKYPAAGLGALFGSRPRRPRNPYSSPSNAAFPFSVFNNLPTPVQSILPIAGIAGLLFLVAAPLLLIILPPVFLASYIYVRRLRSKRQDLFEKRWSDMASYHMVTQTERAALNEQEALKKLVMRRVVQAIQDNEHGIAKKLGFKVSTDEANEGKVSDRELFNRSHLALTDIHSIEEDWRVSPQGIAQNMTVYALGLVDKNRDNLPVADINIVVRTRTPKNALGAPARGNRTQDVRIELVSSIGGVAKKLFVLDGGSSNSGNGGSFSGGSSDEVIDVKARNVREN